MCKPEIFRLWLNDLDRIRTPDAYGVTWLVIKCFIIICFLIYFFNLLKNNCTVLYIYVYSQYIFYVIFTKQAFSGI